MNGFCREGEGGTVDRWLVEVVAEGVPTGLVLWLGSAAIFKRVFTPLAPLGWRSVTALGVGCVGVAVIVNALRRDLFLVNALALLILFVGIGAAIDTRRLSRRARQGRG